MVEPGFDAVGRSANPAAASQIDGPAVAVQAAELPATPAPSIGVSPPSALGSDKHRAAPGPHNPRGIVARCLALSALLGMALVYFTQFSVSADWVTLFLEKNELEMPRRMILIVSGIGGAGLAVVAVALLLARAHRRGTSLASVERGLWLASPLIVLPAVPLVFDARAWTGHHQTLLTVLLPVLLTFEMLVARAWIALPDAAGRAWTRIAERLPEVVRLRGPLAIVSAAATGYVAFMSIQLVRWYHRVQTHNLDLALNNNLVYGGLKGVFMHSPVMQGAAPATYLAAHANYGAYLFLPIYAIVPRPETLLVIGTLLLGLAALPLFGFAREFVSPWTSALICLGYLGYYPLHAANFCDASFLQAGAFFVIVAVWAAQRQRWVWFWVAAVCGMAMSEDMPIGFAMIGLVLLFTGHRPKAGLVTAVLSIAWLVVLRSVIMERAGASTLPDAYRGFLPSGEHSLGSVIGTLVTNPLYVLDRVIAKEKVGYLLHLLVPLAFLPARRWWLWAAFVPGIVLTLLVTDTDIATSFTHQYVLHWVPYLFLAVPLALASIRDQGAYGTARMRAALAAFAFASLVTSFNYGAFPRRESAFKGGYNSVSFGYSARDAGRYADLQQLISLIPRDASVCASEMVAPHVSSRLYIYSLRAGSFHADYVLAAKDDVATGDARKSLQTVAKGPEYGVLRRAGEFVLLGRGAPTNDGAALIADWKL